jgi:hypothetical protein
MRKLPSGQIVKVDYFRNAERGEIFHSNGNIWRKRSSRTAEIIYPERFKPLWFYFGSREIIERPL